MERYLVLAGLLIAAVGLILWWSEAQGWFTLGRLPGDIDIRRDNFRFYFPITTCIIISVLLTLIFYWLRR